RAHIEPVTNWPHSTEKPARFLAGFTNHCNPKRDKLGRCTRLAALSPSQYRSDHAKKPQRTGNRDPHHDEKDWAVSAARRRTFTFARAASANCLSAGKGSIEGFALGRHRLSPWHIEGAN